MNNIIKRILFVLFLLLAVFLSYMFLNSKPSIDEIKKEEQPTLINEKNVIDVSLDELFNANDDELKQFLSKREFYILLARSMTNDNLQEKFDDLNANLIPVKLKNDPEKHFILFYRSTIIDKKNLFDYSFGSGYNIHDLINFNEMMPLLYYSIENEKENLNLEYTESSLTQEFDPLEHEKFKKIFFLKEFSLLTNYNFFKELFLVGELDGSKLIQLKDVLPIFKKLNEVYDPYVWEPEVYDPSTYDFRTESGEHIDTHSHGHAVGENKFQIDKHMMLHAISNYHIVYGEVPIKKEYPFEVDDELLELLLSYGYKVEEFVLLDNNAFYPEFLLHPYTDSEIIFHPQKNVMFFLKPHINDDGEKIY